MKGPPRFLKQCEAMNNFNLSVVNPLSSDRIKSTLKMEMKIIYKDDISNYSS